MIKRNEYISFILIIIVFSVGSFFAGRSTTIGEEIFKFKNNSMKPLRMSGYKFISPLLACDTELELSSPKMDTLTEKIKKYIKSESTAGRLATASIYIRDYNNGYSININPDEKYYPASLNKIPVMITAFKTAKIKPNFLSETYAYSDTNDFNESVEIKPSGYLKAGQSYLINEALDKMIKNSDNNAFYFLTKYLDPDIFKQTFKDLKITLPGDEITPQDYMTVKEFSYFLRVLYNSTYLDYDYSEKAMKLLTQAEFKDGLVAGLPKNTTIAHKFGIRTYEDDGRVARELHDCGIVYKDKPYLICVMTKNNSSLQDSQNVIKDISSMVYKNLRE